MSGLVLKLAPGERFVVNGAVLENGEKTSRIRITDGNARVLRCRDALRPDEVDTPLKQVYFAIQLLITGDLQEDETLPALETECAKLLDIFGTIEPDAVPTLRAMIERGNYYSALCHLRQLMTLEARLLAHRGVETRPMMEAVAV